jgi:hypothetical protein
MGLRRRSSFNVRQLATAGGIWAFGCAEIAGVTEYKVTSEGSSCFGIEREPECASCLQDSCCDAVASCRKDGQCSAFSSCLAECSREDGSCTGACFGDDLTTPKSFATKKWLGCAAAHCAESCLRCGDLGPFGTECTKCASTKGCTQANNCLSDPDCQNYSSCLWENCDYWVLDPSCRVKCGDRYPQGRVRFNAWAAKIGGECIGECRLGQHWECADPNLPDMPIGASDRQTEATVRVVSPLDRTGVSELMVRACNDTESSCETEAPTDMDGFAQLLISQSLSTPGRTYISRYFEIQGANGMRELVYPGRSFTGERAQVELIWVPIFNPFPDIVEPGKGVLIVQLADCVGSFDPTGQNPSATAELADRSVEPFYFAPSAGVAKLQNGPFAVFGKMKTGLHRILINDPDGRRMAEPTARVEADTFTLVYVNFPFTQ